MDVWLGGKRVREAAFHTVWSIDEVMASELAEEEFQPQGSKDTGDKRNAQGCNAVYAEHVDGRCVVAEHQGATVTWAPGQTLPAEAEFPVGEGQSYVGIQ
jgi:hypothetical protein